jgi:hypothetical protein
LGTYLMDKKEHPHTTASQASGQHAGLIYSKTGKTQVGINDFSLVIEVCKGCTLTKIGASHRTSDRIKEGSIRDAQWWRQEGKGGLKAVDYNSDVEDELGPCQGNGVS